MEAPEKIKIGKHNITSDGDVVFGWVANDPDCEAMQHDIEYIRTDAFIEKACKYIRKGGTRGDAYIVTEFGEEVFNFVQLAEDFKNYMKGK